MEPSLLVELHLDSPAEVNRQLSNAFRTSETSAELFPFRVTADALDLVSDDRLEEEVDVRDQSDVNDGALSCEFSGRVSFR